MVWKGIFFSSHLSAFPIPNSGTPDIDDAKHAVTVLKTSSAESTSHKREIYHLRYIYTITKMFCSGLVSKRNQFDHTRKREKKRNNEKIKKSQA